ncbi:MAG: enoyl-CoA hydratase-related protein, partial [Candidatus Nanopelagicales bacterium]
GFGTAYLARIVGARRAREIWFLCRRYSAQQMMDWGLVNVVVPFERLHEEVRAWADEMLALSPTALRIVKHSFNADSESIAGISTMAFDALGVFTGTPESKEGVDAFVEKRSPNFEGYR